MYKLLLIFWFALTIDVAAKATTGMGLVQTAQEPQQEFNELMRRSNQAILSNSQKQALFNLSEAESLLPQLTNTLSTAQAELALAYAQLGRTDKAMFYQQQATSISRSKLGLPINNLNLLAQSYILTNNSNGLQNMFDKVLKSAPQSQQRPLKIAYVNSLFGVDENVKAANLLTELYSDTPMSASEQAEVLSLLLINSIKLNQPQLLAQYYRELEDLKVISSPVMLLAKGMYLEQLQQYLSASKNYHVLWSAFRNGKREIVYLDGLLQLAQLKSKQLLKDSADYFFGQLYKAIPKPVATSAIGIRYLKYHQAHLNRFNVASSKGLNSVLLAKDSLYRNELVALTKELSYRYKIEKDKQKAALLQQQRDLQALRYAKNKQRTTWIIACLGLLLFSGAILIYFLYHRRQQAKKLHRVEMERLKQLHRTEVIKTLSASQEEERWRIADQLHDEVGSMISVARLNLSLNPLKQEDISVEKLETANRILANLADTVREMSHQLMPVAIRQYGLIKSIEQLITDINTSGKIYIEHLIHGFGDLSKYPEDFQVSFYRIVQELFQNVVKHAKATNAIFQLVEHPDSINLYIEDNGRGMTDDAGKKGGKGISLLAHRIDYYEGKISIEGEPGKGTLIMIDIPTLHMKS